MMFASSWLLFSSLAASGFDFTAPLPIIIAAVVIVVGLLFLMFIIKSAITLLKIAFLVALAIGAYFGFAWLSANVL